MRVMFFEHNVHGRGVNVTVRRGKKWSDLRNDEEIRLMQTDGADAAYRARVVVALTMAFAHVPTGVLPYCNDPDCRTLSGLVATMRRLYPDFSPEDEVTVVLYYVV